MQSSEEWAPALVADVPGYILEDTLAAIRRGEGQDGRPGTFVRIPPGSVVELQGWSEKPGMVDILWDGHLHTVFSHDLEVRSSRLEPAS